MSIFKQYTPTLCQYWQDGKDHTGIVTGSPAGRPGVTLETVQGESIDLNYLEDVFTIHPPESPQWPFLMRDHIAAKEAA